MLNCCFPGIFFLGFAEAVSGKKTSDESPDPRIPAPISDCLRKFLLFDAMVSLIYFGMKVKRIFELPHPNIDPDLKSTFQPPRHQGTRLKLKTISN